MNNLSIKIKNRVYKFPRLEYETNNSYFTRKDFFVKASPTTEKEYKNAINMSIVYVNIKLNGCIYPQSVIFGMNKLYK